MKDMIDTEMTTLARSLFDAFAAGDLAAWEARLAPDFTFSYPGLPDGKGVAAARAYNQPFKDAFSDWLTEVHSAAINDDTVFLRMIVHATHSAPLVGPAGTMPPSGRRGAVPCVLVARIRNGRIAHEATYWNVPDLLAQIA